MYVDLRVPVSMVRVAPGKNFRAMLKEWARSEEHMFTQLEQCESAIVDETVLLHKAAVRESVLKPERTSGRVL